MKIHKPDILKIETPKRTEVSYAIGTMHNPGEMGMYWGPSTSLDDTLNQIGETSNCFIVKFNLDDTQEFIYRWDFEGEHWFEFGGKSEVLNLRKLLPSEPFDFRLDRGHSALANPFKMNNKTSEERDRVCDLYTGWLLDQIQRGDKPILLELAKLNVAFEKYGKLRLFCWCAPERCHTQTVLELLSI